MLKFTGHKLAQNYLLPMGAKSLCRQTVGASFELFLDENLPGMQPETCWPSSFRLSTSIPFRVSTCTVDHCRHLAFDFITGGSITLNSSDPFDHPIVDFNMLSEDVDIAIMREGIRSTRRLMSAPVFADSVFGSAYPASNITADEDLDLFLRTAVGPYGHAGCSAGMSPRGVNWGVVDPDHKVKGTTGLRLVDASVFVSKRFIS
jgi:hypothetical protein